MRSGELGSVHGVGEEGLGVQSVGHVEAVPGFVEGEEDDVGGVRENFDEVQKVRERDAGPFGDEGPAFFAGLMGDLGAGGEALQLRQREGRGAGDQAVDGEPPIGEAAGEQALVFVVRGRGTVDGEGSGDLGAVEFAGEGGTGGHQEALAGIGEGFADAEEAGVIGRDEAVTVRDAGGGG